MRGWGLAPADAERIVARLVADRFIDDRRYADAFVREKMRLSGWGAYKIRAALRRKGIAPETIDAAWAAVDPAGMGDRLRTQLARKVRTLRAATPRELKTKLIRYGLSLGYDYETVLPGRGGVHRRVRRMRRLLTLVFAALAASLPAARGAEPGAYAYPVRGVAGLHAASFGEIRPGHFHAGIDIKSDGAEGKELAAVADGYVARIIVTPGGYGRALYLALRDGRTAVYGHLQRFRDDIEERLRSERYARRANDVDLHFAAGEYPVRRGDLVGYSGNSGASMGPHLHFELRESRTQRRCNILREGHFRPADDLPHASSASTTSRSTHLDGIAVEAPAESYAAVRTAEGRYRLTRNEPVGIGRRGYFVVEATDRRNGVHNTFGIWRLTASIDREPYFEYRMEGFAPEAARCCDAVSRYGLQLRTRNEAIRLAQAEGAPDCFYRLAKERGSCAPTQAGSAVSASRPRTTWATVRRSNSPSKAARRSSGPAGSRAASPCGTTARVRRPSATRRRPASPPVRSTPRATATPNAAKRPPPWKAPRCSRPPTGCSTPRRPSATR